MTEQQVYCIRITFHDEESNRLLTLGGAAWEAEDEWKHEWNASPVARDDSSRCLADKIDGNGDLVNDRDVSVRFVEALLDAPISQLIEEARQAKS
jgi:hypothetical protein